MVLFTKSTVKGMCLCSVVRRTCPARPTLNDVPPAEDQSWSKVGRDERFSTCERVKECMRM